MNIIDKALEFATKAHEGQTRWDKKTPYITHPIAVAEIAKNFYYDYFLSELYFDTVVAVSLLHDVIEDCGVTKEQLTLEFNEDIAKSVDRLSKKEDDDYLSFIIRAKNSNITKVVKIADIYHNLLDLKKGSMRDKYLLAKYILEN